MRFWASIFDPKRSTIIVPADSSLVLMDELTGTEIHLQEYTTKRYRNFTPPSGFERLWSVLVESQYTNVADLRIVSQLERLPEVDPTKTQIRFARDLSVSEVKQNNVVLLGSARANPWVELFDGYGRFRVGYDARQRKTWWRTANPGPGEKAGLRGAGRCQRTPGVRGHRLPAKSRRPKLVAPRWRYQQGGYGGCSRVPAQPGVPEVPDTARRHGKPRPISNYCSPRAI